MNRCDQGHSGWAWLWYPVKLKEPANTAGYKSGYLGVSDNESRTACLESA
jgi:hypothetical protein